MILNRSSSAVLFLFLANLVAAIPPCHAQESSSGTDLPYRRIFIPQGNLGGMDLTGYSGMDAVELNQKLSQHFESTSAESATSNAPNSRSDLISSHYVASLVGADLVSERSRLMFTTSGNSSERFTLQPFSLAIHPKSGPNTLPSSWTFDEQGNPRLPLVRSTASNEGGLSNAREVTHWFGWSSRSQSRSSPYRLYFSLSVPRCADSCLLLVLPPKAVVQDSNTVATKLDSWQQAVERLGTWPENTTDSKPGPTTGESSWPLWLIELGGVQNATFTIVLSEADRSLETRDDGQVIRYSQLIRSQRIEHVITGEEIRTLCEAELTTNSRQPSPIRMSVPADSRIRKFRVDGVDANWEIVQGRIQWQNPANSVDLINVSSPLRISAEFLTLMDDSMKPEIELPRIAFDQSYVVSGLTVIKAQSPWNIGTVRCEPARLVDSSSGNRNATLAPLEYTWQARPPVCSVGIHPNQETRQFDCFTRLSCESQGVHAVSRFRLQFLDQDSSHVALALGKNWNVLKVESMDRSDPLSFQYDAATSSLRIDWERIQKNRVADLEIQLFSPHPDRDAAQTLRSFRPSTLFELKGWKSNHVLMVEESGPYKFHLNELIFDRFVNEESLSEWMRRLLPRSVRYFLIRLSPDQLGSTRSHDDLELRWNEPPELRSASIQTNLIATEGKMIVLQHEFRIQTGGNRDANLEILLPQSQVQWSAGYSDEWKALDPLVNATGTTTSERGRWRFQFPTSENELVLRAKSILELDLEKTIEIELPILPNYHINSHTVKASPQLLVERRGEKDRWSIDSSGSRVLHLSKTTSEEHFQLSIQRTRSESWNAYTANLELKVDLNGSQTAQCDIRTKFPYSKPWTISLSDGWEPIDVLLKSSQGNKKVPINFSNNVLLIPTPDSQEFVSELRITLRGSPLVSKATNVWLPQLARDRTLFRWPKIESNLEQLALRRRLLLPPELTVEGTSADLEQELVWPVWNYNTLLAKYLGFHFLTNFFPEAEDGNSMPTLQSQRTAKAGMWRVAYTDCFSKLSNESESSFTNEIYIARVDYGRSVFVLAFAIAAWLTPTLVLKSFRIAVLVAFLVVLICNLGLKAPFDSLFYAILIGMCFGYTILSLYLVWSSRRESDSATNRRHSTRWLPWNVSDDMQDTNSKKLADRDAKALSPKHAASTLGSIAIWILIGSLIECTLFSGHVTAQAQSNSQSIYSVLVPVDDKGSLAGSVVYVQDELRNLLSKHNAKGQDEGLGSKVISIRYFLKLGGRTKLDQLTISYEFHVGEDLAPIRFPFADHVQAMRFVVDSNEINPLTSSRLRRNGQEWIWVPEKAGKRSIQILGQPRLMQIDSSSKESGVATYQIDLPLVPSSNATIDIEAEPPLGIDLVSRGQMANPNSGRYSAMLGGLDRLQCKITVPISSSTGFTTPFDASESCTMHTEYLLQNDLLQAKTVFDFPKGIPLGKQVEIEAESTWIPIGAEWGDAHWVEVRGGSTLSRRRYILEWNSPPGTLSANTRERHVSIYWVPQQGQQNLNVLFAEVRNHRMKYGNLRFSRVPGADWSLEGINTWSPLNHPDEKLDWSELGVTAPATSLRIPTNGGFAVLKNRSNSDRLKARVFSKWSIDANGEMLNCRIELIGTASSDTLYVDLPSDFEIQEILDRNGSIRFLEHLHGNKLRVQILEDRKSIETGILEIQARRLESQPQSKWRDIPWIELPQVSESDQSLEYILSDRVVIRLDNAPQKMITGKWPSQSIGTLTRSSVNLEQESTIPRRFEVVPRSTPVRGLIAVVCGNIFKGDASEVEVRASITQDASSRPSFIIEIPIALKDHWESELRINTIACPDPNKSWIQVSLPETDESKQATYFSISFDLAFEEEAADILSLISQIRAVNDETVATYFAFREESPRIPAFLLPASDSHRDDVIRDVRLPSSASVHTLGPVRTNSIDAHRPHTPAQIEVAQCVYELAGVGELCGSSHSKVVLDSKYWFGDKEGGPDSQMELEWELAGNVEAVSVVSNGRPISFSQTGKRVKASPIFLGLCQEIVLTTIQSNEEADAKVSRIYGPHLESHSIVATTFLDRSQRWTIDVNNAILTPREYESALLELAIKWQDLLAASLEKQPDSLSRDRGSEWDLWLGHWLEQSAMQLSQLRSNDSKIATPYAALVRQFHKFRGHAKVSLDEELDARWKNRIVSHWDQMDSAAPPHPAGAELGRSNSDRWYPMAVSCFLLVVIVLISRNLYQQLTRRPWWYLILVGCFIWIWSGWVAPLIVLGICGLIVQLDTYLITNERLRRIGTRGPR